MGDSVPKHTGPISLTDTHPRTEHLQNPIASGCFSIDVQKNGMIMADNGSLMYLSVSLTGT
jgi:hypothetical protein